EPDGVYRRRLRPEIVVPDPDRVGECLPADRVDISEGRSSGHDRDRGIREESGLRADCRDVPGASELERYRQGGDRDRYSERRPGSNKRHSEDRRDHRTRPWLWNVLAPEQLRSYLTSHAKRERDAQHLRCRELENHKACRHRGGQCDPDGQVIRQRSWIESGPVKPGPGTSQHAWIVGIGGSPAPLDRSGLPLSPAPCRARSDLPMGWGGQAWVIIGRLVSLSSR